MQTFAYGGGTSRDSGGSAIQGRQGAGQREGGPVIRFALLLSFASLLWGNTLLMSITGTNGNVCTMYKSSGNNIYASYSCLSKDQKQSLSGVIYADRTRNAPGSTVWGMGPVLCLVGINTTERPLAMGSLGMVPAGGIAWSCTPGERKATVAGTAVWP